MVDHYQILGVHPSASTREIRAAYLALIKRHHPDARQHPQGQEDDRVREFNLAYAVLRDAEKRAEHDAAREMAARPAVHSQVHPGQAYAPAASRGRNGRNVSAFALVCCVAVVSVVIGAQSESTPYTLSSEPPADVEYAIVLPTRLPAVEKEAAGNAYSDADYILRKGTPGDAATHSGQCFNELALSPGLELLDRCVAFDLAAARWLAANGRAADEFFSAAAMNQRHLAAFSGLSFGAATARPRVAELRRLVAAEADRHSGKLRAMPNKS